MFAGVPIQEAKRCSTYSHSEGEIVGVRPGQSAHYACAQGLKKISRNVVEGFTSESITP